MINLSDESQCTTRTQFTIPPLGEDATEFSSSIAINTCLFGQLLFYSVYYFYAGSVLKKEESAEFKFMNFLIYGVILCYLLVIQDLIALAACTSNQLASKALSIT